MIRKNAVLIAILVSLSFLMIATLLYPGGSISNKNSVGFDWTKNFISNLFATRAINGAENPSRIWALIGMVFHSASHALFFLNMSPKMPEKYSGIILKYLGLANMLFTFLIATSLHDQMIVVSSTLFLIGLFFITVYILRTKLVLLKFSCIICMLVFYYTLYLYGTGDWGLLAIMQKITFISSMLLMLGLVYCSTAADFKPRRSAGHKQTATGRV